MSEFTPRDRALQALDASEEGDGSPEHNAAAQRYATRAVAESILAVHDVLIDVRDQLEMMRRARR